jgi:phenylacetate-CoA ligase
MNFRRLLARHVFYPAILWQCGEIGELHYLREFERTQFLPHTRIKLIATELLQQLIHHAFTNCRFYRQRFERAGIAPGDIRQLHDLQAIPPLEKADIQNHRDDMVAANWPRTDLISNQTGGSTGAPISFFLSKDRVLSRKAATRRHDEWAGLGIGDRIAEIWGAPPVQSTKVRSWLRGRLLEPCLCLDTSNLSMARFDRFSERLKSFRPKVIVAYARSLALFARYLDHHNVSAYRPESIITSAELLTDDDRHLIESVFGCPVFNRYGCREVSVIASECSRHEGLHIMAEGLHVEVVRNGRGVATGQMGDILVTDLRNLAMPLIRYKIGDLAILDETPCPCGRGLPRLKNIAGRSTDFLVGADGRLVSGVFLATYVIAQRPALGQVQILQDESRKVHYRVCNGSHLCLSEEDRTFLKATTKQYLGDDVAVDVELTRELPQTASGKLLYCQSRADTHWVKR